MTERTPDDAFDSIVANLRHEQVDPLAQPLFHRVQEYAQQIDGMAISKVEAKRIKDELNNLVYDLDFDADDIMIRVSGRARLQDEADVGLLADSRRTPNLHAFQPGVTEQFDDDGPYYPVYRQVCSLDYVAVEPAGEWVDGVAPHRISYRLTVSVFDYDELAASDETDEEPSEAAKQAATDTDDGSFIDIVMYASDVSSIERSDAALERVARDLHKYFPEVATQLESIQYNPLDEMEAVRAIKQLDLRFDWTNTPYRDAEDRQAIIDVVSNLLSEKLHFDSSMYQIEFQGLITGIQPDGSPVRQVQSGRRTLNGTFVGTLLERVDDPDAPEDVSEYYVTAAISQQMYGWGRGNGFVMLPLASMTGLTNLRNEPIFAEPLLEFTDNEQPVEREYPESAESDRIPPQPERSVVADRPERLSETELERYHADFMKLWRGMQKYHDKEYVSPDAAKTVQQYLTAAIQDFMKRHPRFERLPVRFQGECIEYVSEPSNTGMIIKKAPFQLEFTDNTLKQGDYATIREGHFQGRTEVVLETIDTADGQRFKVLPYLFFEQDRHRGTAWSTPEGAQFSTGLLELTYNAETRFAVQLTEPGSLELIDLEKARKFKESLAHLVQQAPDKTFLPVYLSDIQQDVEGELPNAFISISAENLRAVGEQTHGNPELALLAAEALSSIFGERHMIVAGKMYDNTGVEQEQQIHAKLLTVVESVPVAKIEEPALVMMSPQDKLYYVPITSLTTVQL